MKSYFVPVKIMIEKVPFLEYSLRMLKFAVYPMISRKEIADNDLRYALTDLVLSFSLAFLAIALSTGNQSELGFKAIISIFNIEWLVFSFIYYTIFPVLVFTVIYYFLFKFRWHSDNPKKESFLLSLHFIRTHSITIVCAILGFAYILSLYFNKGIHPKHFESYFSGLEHSGYYSLIFIIVIGYVYFTPVALYTKVKRGTKSFMKSFGLVVIVYSFSIGFNSFLPSDFISNILDEEKLCEVSKKAPIYHKLTQAEQKLMISAVCT